MQLKILSFEKMEIESLISQACNLQASASAHDKIELARVKIEMICVEKEKNLAEQQVQKLQVKISQLEVLQLQAEKSASDREMSLLAMNKEVINHYHNLCTELYENYSDRNDGNNNWMSSEQLHESWELVNQFKVKLEQFESGLIQTQQPPDDFEEECSKSIHNHIQSVKDSINIEGATLRDQQTRINDLEELVSADLQYAFENVRSQLTFAKIDVTKWIQLARFNVTSKKYLFEYNLVENLCTIITIVYTLILILPMLKIELADRKLKEFDAFSDQ